MGPILFVSNHQLVGIDSFMVVAELWNTGIFVRSMTHPSLSKLPGASFLDNFGCLPVSPKTFYKLMKTKQPSLLFPGGAREAFHKSNEEYTLTAWAETTDFVRIAAKFNATIVPFSSVGAAESALFLDQLPFNVAENIDDALLQLVNPSQGTPYNARYDGGEDISFPLVLPKTFPDRHYFLFSDQIDTTKVDYRDRDECRKIYQMVKQTIKQGCRDLTNAREQDPYNDAFKRLTYEQFWRKQAPTFPISLLNSW